MGANPSKTRTLTVENDDPTSVIKVSDDVVDRIRGVAQTVRNQEAALASAAPLPTQQATAVPFYLYEPSLTSIQLRQANVDELKKNDDYWKNRLKTLEEKHKKMNTILEEERQKAVHEMSLGTATASLKEIPCLDAQKAVVQCYKCNPNEPMKCAKIVQAFQECVDYKRSCLLASRAESSKG